MGNHKRNPARVGIAERVDSKGRTRYRGVAYDRRTRRHLRGPWTHSLAAARAWRVDAMARLAHGTASAALTPTIREAAEQFITGIEGRSILRDSGAPYKPAAVRGYKRELRKRVVPAFGPTRLGDLERTDVQRWTDSLVGEGLAPQTVRNIITPLQALYRWALSRGYAHANPTTALELPKGGRKRDRVVSTAMAGELVAALASRDQACYGLAVYGGLRLGEALALDWSMVDLEANTLHVERAWDPKAREFVAPQSAAGYRTVPITAPLAALLADHSVLTDHRPGLLFPARSDSTRPMSANALTDRIDRAWKAASLERLTFHEARHVAASHWIAAGLDLKRISTFLGHSSVSTTMDRYAHLLDGAEDQARDLLDNFHGYGMGTGSGAD